MYLGGKSRWVSLWFNPKWRIITFRKDTLHGTQRRQAFTYGPYRMTQHKNLSINTTSNQYLQTCTQKTPSAHSY